MKRFGVALVVVAFAACGEKDVHVEPGPPALAKEPRKLPPGHGYVDRIAIHGTTQAETIGQAASNGCLRASDADLRVLMRDVPVGAPVFIEE